MIPCGRRMSQPPATSTSGTRRKPLPRWAVLLLVFGIPTFCIVFCKLVGMGNIETTAFTILCIFGIGVTYFTHEPGHYTISQRRTSCRGFPCQKPRCQADRTAHAQGLPRLPARPDDPARALAGDGPARSTARYGFAPDRHAGPGIRRDPARQGRRGVGQAALPLQGPRRPRRGPALRPDRAVRPLRRPAHRQARHAVQALSHGPGLARREHRQHGRYREFWQCDFDTIGTTSQRRRHRGRAGHPRPVRGAGLRAVSQSTSTTAWCSTACSKSWAWRTTAVPSCASLDKLPKIGRGRGRRRDGEKAGVDRRAGRARARPGRDRAAPTPRSSTGCKREFGGNAKAAEGIRRFGELLDGRDDRRASPRSALRIDLSIARGLDYYTGTIYETFLDATCPTIGSVCSGGRYDNLAGLYTKQELPGVGASLGLDRLLAAMEELKLLPTASHAGAGAGRAVRRRARSATTSAGPPAAAGGHRRRGLSRTRRRSASNWSTPRSAASSSR